MKISGALYTPAREFICDLSSVTGLRFGTISPGGCYTASWTMTSTAALPSSSIPQTDLHVDLMCNGSLVWSGIVDSVKTSMSRYVTEWSVSAVGYGVVFTDNPVEADLSYPLGSTVEGVLRTVKGFYSGILATDNRMIGSTGRQLAAATANYRGKLPMQIINDMIVLGDSLNQELTWHVWPGDRSGENRPIFELKTRDTVASYSVSVNEGAIVSSESSRKDQYTRVQISYAGGLTATERDASLEAAWPVGRGRARTLQVNASDVTDEAIARRDARALLVRAGTHKAKGESIFIPRGCRISYAGGGTCQPELVQAGKVIYVADMKSRGIDLVDSTFYIGQTDYNSDSDELTITPYGPDDLSALLGRLLYPTT